MKQVDRLNIALAIMVWFCTGALSIPAIMDYEGTSFHGKMLLYIFMLVNLIMLIITFLGKWGDLNNLKDDE